MVARRQAMEDGGAVLPWISCDELVEAPAMNPSMVSICVPVFNGGRYLPECLDSILAQTWEDLDIVVVDDGSTDESADLVADCARRDRRIRFLQNPENVGLVRNWNRCLLLSRG
jgi:glycosyltransferase involved in cell wall biosynthesis